MAQFRVQPAHPVGNKRRPAAPLRRPSLHPPQVKTVGFPPPDSSQPRLPATPCPLRAQRAEGTSTASGVRGGTRSGLRLMTRCRRCLTDARQECERRATADYRRSGCRTETRVIKEAGRLKPDPWPTGGTASLPRSRTKQQLG